MTTTLKQIAPYRYLVPKNFKKGMLIEGLIFASDELIGAIQNDETIQQVANVAALPGMVGYSLAMPDAHQGYGFAIGGVAAADVEKGVVSAGGVGFDINCGVRLLSTDFTIDELRPYLDNLLNELFRAIPCGTGKGGRLTITQNVLDEVLQRGAQWAVENRFGTPEDIDHTEEHGCMIHAQASTVSKRAKERGAPQLGTLGSGNHFIEIQYVADIYDQSVANVFGIQLNQICVMIHSGSRGLGHQVCSDYLETMNEAMSKYNIHVDDRQLACVPIQSKEGQAYIAAMAASANFAFANRQIMTHWIRESFHSVLKRGTLQIVYDVAHNIAKFETHQVHGKAHKVLVHRKGATRAFPANTPGVPMDYLTVGQPVLVPGSMGTASYVLVGTQRAMEETFGSTCHGAGRAMSRHAAKKQESADRLIAELKAKGILVRGATKSGLVEEKPEAYKNVDQVVEVMHNAGIARKVARLLPLGVIKG
ncbi:MAG: RtcB family protein [Bacteroidetes bacterium]|nr:RtcB family protein [Bacteroidota bacterium]